MNGANFPLFLAAALVIAAVPGPGIFYVAARTLSGGRKAGIASTLGTALGGLVHVVAGALGVFGHHPRQCRTVHCAQIRGRLLSGLAWHPDLSRRPTSNAGGDQPGGRRAGLSGRRHGRSLESEDRGVLSGVHSAIYRAGRWPRCPPVHGARPDLGRAQHARRCYRGDDGSDRARRFVGRPQLLQRLRQGSGLFMAGLGISLALVRRPAAS
jgi:hypothetical protein